MKRVIALLGAVAVLAACGPSHKGQHCVQSHDEPSYIAMCIMYNQQGGCTLSVPVQVETTTVCDKWVADNPAVIKQ